MKTNATQLKNLSKFLKEKKMIIEWNKYYDLFIYLKINKYVTLFYETNCDKNFGQVIMCIFLTLTISQLKL